MRRVISVVLSVVSVIAAVVVAVALSGSSHASKAQQAGGVVPTLPGSVNVVRYQTSGATASCNADGSCGGSGSGSPNLQFVLPASSVPYRSTLTISFRYRATGKGATFSVSGNLSGPGHFASMTPASRPLGPTGGTYQTATMVFRPSQLSGGINYLFGVDPEVAQHVGNARIAVDHVVYSLQAWIAR